MTLNELKDRIERKEARLAVIGLGYVGLPLACLFAEAGYDVLGVEQNQERLEKIAAGQMPFAGVEPGLPELLAKVISAKRLRPTDHYAELADRQVIFICVETPVDEQHAPHYLALRQALQSLGAVLQTGALVIVESTLAPGTMQGLVAPLLEEASRKALNRDFYLGYCPERVMPGRLLSNLRQLSRVVGGMNAETAETMAALYRQIVQAELDLTDCLTAELVKTIENTYRDVQIAFANEVALICSAVGGNVWRVRELVNKSPGRQMLLPGAGVGGHCLPKDPWLLAHSVRTLNLPLRLIPAARQVNDSMPVHVFELLKKALSRRGRQVEGSRVLILGYAYLEETDDARNSPSAALVALLRQSGAEVLIHDPFIAAYQGSVMEKVAGCEALVLMVKHRAYQALDLAALVGVMRQPILVDGRGAFQPEVVESAGFDYWGVGVPPPP